MAAARTQLKGMWSLKKADLQDLYEDLTKEPVYPKWGCLEIREMLKEWGCRNSMGSDNVPELKGWPLYTSDAADEPTRWECRCLA